MEERSPLEVFGKNRSLRIDGSTITETKGNSKVTAIPITSIQNVTIYPAGFLRGAHGSIVVRTSNRGGIFGVEFLGPDELLYAQNIQKYIAEFQANSNALNIVTPCELDQIAKLKGLLDSGAITEEEFEAKKKQLLGL